MILLVDNYDSFVHNLARHFRLLGEETTVVRNDQIDANAARAMQPKAIVLSPGPGTPEDAGCSIEIVKQLGRQTPVLGVCLGHQAIGAACGARVMRAPHPVHGRASEVRHDRGGLFAGVASPLAVGRYHSLAIDGETLPAELTATAWTDDGLVMAVAHRTWPIVGVQFHPESVLTESGLPLLRNFLSMANRWPAAPQRQVSSTPRTADV